MTDLSRPEILDSLTTGIMVLNQDMRVCYLNAAAEALLGSSDSRSAGARVDSLFCDIDIDLVTSLDATLTTGQSFTRRAAHFRTRDGQDVIADLTASPELRNRHVIIEIQPINRLLRINRDDYSLHLQETARKLVRGLAHEIKNPLGGVRGAAQLLERELDGNPLKEYTQVIIDEADRLKDLVDRLLGPNRKPRKTDVNIHSVLEHVVRLIHAQSSGTIRFQRDYDPSLPAVHADESQLIQAVLNIAANAVQALEGRPDPCIGVRTRVVRQFTIGTRLHRMVVQFDITDNGPGIPDEILERMYFPMISGRADGTGLGLAITQTIIHQHGGIIECQSRPGHTCFSIFLPLEDKADE